MLRLSNGGRRSLCAQYPASLPPTATRPGEAGHGRVPAHSRPEEALVLQGFNGDWALGRSDP
eukprot:7946529-Pyramimonas_sp.AAC.1